MKYARFLPPLLATVLLLTSAGCKNDDILTEDPRPELILLPDLNGDTFDLRSTEGKVVLLNFFAPWCPTCQEETPDLVALYEEFKGQDLVVLGIAMSAESMEQIEQYRDAFEVSYPILVDDGRLGREGYRVTGFPTNYIIDRDVTLHGPFGSETKAQLEERIRPML